MHSPDILYSLPYSDRIQDDVKKSDVKNGVLLNGSESALNNRTSRSCSNDSKDSLHVQFEEETCSEKDCSIKNIPNGADISSPPSSSSQDSSSEDEDGSSVNEAQPPDGGWGWVVVAAAFFTNMIADGITFSFGVIYVELLSYFQEGKSKTAWIAGIFMAMPLISGPIASYLTDRYGCRRVCMFGAILSAFGFVISSVANSIEVLIFTFGIVAGLGLSLCYVAAVVIVAYYFEKKRSFATGLAVCGSGMGTFVFAPISNFLLKEFGWRGSTLILSGLFLNMAVCGALMRDLEWTKEKSKKLRKDRKQKNREKRLKRASQSLKSHTSSVESVNQNPSDIPNVHELKRLLQKGETPGYLLPKLEEIEEDNMRQYSSTLNLPTFVCNGEKVPLEVLEQLSNNKKMYQILIQNYPGLMIPSHSFSDSGKLHEMVSKDQVKIEPRKNKKKLTQLLIIPHPGANSPSYSFQEFKHCNKNVWPNNATAVDKKTHTSYLKDIKMHRHSMTYRGAMLNIRKYRLRASSCPDMYRNSMITISKEEDVPYGWLWDMVDIVKDMLDVSIFSDKEFLLFAISNFLLYTWYHVPYVFLADKAVEMGINTDDASYLISYLGILNMLGEVGLGWAGDQTWMNADVVYAVCMIVCGLFTIIVPLLSSYMGLAIISGGFGFSVAANYSLASVILVDLISLDRFTNAYGLLLLVQGIANLIGPPLAGWLYDLSGNYDLSFYLAGFFIILCGVLLMILPSMKWGRKQYKKKMMIKSRESSTSMKESASESV